MKLVTIDELKTGDLIKVYNINTKRQLCLVEFAPNNTRAVLCLDRGSIFSIFIEKTLRIDPLIQVPKIKIFVNSKIYQLNLFSYVGFEIIK